MFGWRPKQIKIPNWNIVLGDQVIVNTGSYKGQTGKVTKVYKQKNMVTVTGVNLKFKKVDDEENQRLKKTIQKEFPIHISNVMLIDPQLKTGTKIKTGYLEDGTKVRVSKKTGALIPKPDRTHLSYFQRNKDKGIGPRDTDPQLVLSKSYAGEDFMKLEYEFEQYIRLKEEKEKLFVFDK